MPETPHFPEQPADDPRVIEEEQAAAEEAGSIGGKVTYASGLEGDADVDEAQRAVTEGGGGEAEGFELAERELEQHASHGDEHAAGRIIQDASDEAIEPPGELRE